MAGLGPLALALVAAFLAAAASPAAAFAVPGHGLALRPRALGHSLSSSRHAFGQGSRELGGRPGVWQSPRAGVFKRLVKMHSAATLAAGVFVGFNVWYLSQALYEPTPTPDPYTAISDVEVLRVTDGSPVKELAATVMRELKPKLDQQGVRLVAVGIGIPEVGREFCDLTGFDPEFLFADPDNAAYEALELEKTVRALAFNPRTPFSLARRFINGEGGDLVNALTKWRPWIPPKLEQGLQQGGVYVFDGTKSLFEHKDAGTGAFADLKKVLETATEGTCKV